MKYVMYVNVGDSPAAKSEEIVRSAKAAIEEGGVKKPNEAWAFIAVRDRNTSIELLPNEWEYNGKSS